jgi:hypothetical protein
MWQLGICSFYLTQTFSNRRLGKLAKRFFLQAQVSSANSNSIPFPQHDPPTHKCFLCSLAFGHAWEYIQTTHALAPFSPTPTSSNTTSTFTTLHFKSDGYFSSFLDDYEPDQDLKLSFYSFKLAFQHMPHLLASGFLGMVFEHISDCFHLEDSTSGFPQLFQLCFHITHGHIPPQIADVLGVACLLTMTKSLGGISPIIVGKHCMNS